MKYWLTVGRFQPLHDGHEKLIRSKLDKGKGVVVLLRDTQLSKKNPHGVGARYEMFVKRFKKEIGDCSLIINVCPDIEGIFYGRDVGYKVEQVRLDKKTEEISGTKLRKEKNIELPIDVDDMLLKHANIKVPPNNTAV